MTEEQLAGQGWEAAAIEAWLSGDEAAANRHARVAVEGTPADPAAEAR